ncbi:MAG TPA: hypothetical protein VFY29_15495, partial [Terriglobia bacterium]|nr:hypothetical protein [Terriglobia bacterium]
VTRHIRMRVGNVSLMPKACTGKSVQELEQMFVANQAAERQRVIASMDDGNTQRLVQETCARLEASLVDGSWKTTIPGKPILASFASAAAIPLGRLKSLYISKNSLHGFNAFREIEEIFLDWSE